MVMFLNPGQIAGPGKAKKKKAGAVNTITPSTNGGGRPGVAPAQASCLWCQRGECWDHGPIAAAFAKGVAKGAALAAGGNLPAAGRLPAAGGKGADVAPKGKSATSFGALAAAAAVQRAGKAVPKGKGGKGGIITPAMSAIANGPRGVIQRQTKQATQAQANSNANVASYKALLNDSVSQQLGTRSTHGDVLYELMQVGENPPVFVSRVSFPTLEPGNVFEGQPQPNKKLAEQSAAESVLRAKGVIANGGQNQKKKKKTQAAPTMQLQQPGQMQRKAAQQMQQRAAVPMAKKQQGQLAGKTGPVHDFKSKLLHAAQVLAGRTCVKEDVVWAHEAYGEPPSSYKASVRLVCIDPSTAHEGEVMATKKEAEASAAAQALAALEYQLVPAMEAHQRMKREKLAMKRNAKGLPNGGSA